MPRKRTPHAIAQAEQDAAALELRKQYFTFEQIAERLGFYDRSGARKAVARAMDLLTDVPAGELRELETERLIEQARQIAAIAGASHPVLYKGKVVYVKDEAGNEVMLEDAGVVLAAHDRLVKISESIRKLNGWDAAQKFAVGGDPDGVPVDLTIGGILAKLAEARGETVVPTEGTVA